MSENKETLMPSAPKDNSIVSRKKYVKESLDLIKEKKDRLRQTMKAISESEQPDLEVMGKLLQAYDTMTEQENQYLEVLKSIVIIHEHAVEDVAQDLAAAKAELAAQPNIKPPVASENPANEPASEEDMKELLDTLKEIHDVSKQAALAAQINEQLQDKLNLHKNKKAALQEIRKEKAEALQKKANETLTAVEMTKIKLDNEKQAKKQKEKELERLRKTALQKGIELGVVEENMKDAAIKAISDLTSDAQRIPPTMGETEEEREEKPSLTKEEQMEERRKEIRENIKKERERKELVNQQIREKLKAVEARKDRIRQLREMLEISHKHALAEQAEQDAQQQAQEHAEQQNEKPAEEQVKQQAEKKTSNDLEKDDHKEEELHSLDRQISSDIHDDMTEEELREYERTEKELSETIRNATFNLQNLTLMRMRLEDMQARGESISEEDAQLIDRLDNHGGNEQSSEAIEDQAPPVPTSSPPSASLEKEVCRSITRF